MAAETWSEALRAELAARKKVPECGICRAENRSEIEAAREEGVPYAILARALIRFGVFEPSVRMETASKRVSVHFQEHGRETA